MALNTRNLTAPGEVNVVDGAKIAASVAGNGGNAPMWSVGNPVATALSGLASSWEKYADVYDDVQVNDYMMRKSKELDEMYNNPDTGLFQTMKGEQAEGMYENFRKQAQDMWDKDAADNLSDRQRRLAAKPMKALFDDYRHRIARHETQERMGVMDRKINNAADTAMNLLSSGKFDEETMGNCLNGLRMAMLTKGATQGWDKDTIERETRNLMGQSIAKGASALAAVDASSALKVVKDYLDYIPEAQREAILDTLDNKVKGQNSNHYKELIAAGKIEEAEAFLRGNSPQGRPYPAFGGVGTGPGKHSVGGYTYPAGGKENDTPAYVSFVEQKTGLSADTKIDVNNTDQMARMLHAMAQKESGLIKRSGLTVEDVKYMLETGKDPESLDYSKLGKDRAERNFNPGNLKSTNGDFKKFGSLAEGFKANWEALKRYQSNKGCEYLADYIYTWAPPTSNGWTVAERKSGKKYDANLRGAGNSNASGVGASGQSSASNEVVSTEFGAVGGYQKHSGMFTNNEYQELHDWGKRWIETKTVEDAVENVLARINSDGNVSYKTKEQRRAAAIEYSKDIPSPALQKKVQTAALKRLDDIFAVEEANNQTMVESFLDSVRQQNPNITIGEIRQAAVANKLPQPVIDRIDSVLRKKGADGESQLNGHGNFMASDAGLRKYRAAYDANPNMTDAEKNRLCWEYGLNDTDYKTAMAYKGRIDAYSQTRIDGLIDKVDKSADEEKRGKLYTAVLQTIPPGETWDDKKVLQLISNLYKKYSEEEKENSKAWQFFGGAKTSTVKTPLYEAIASGKGIKVMPDEESNEMRDIVSYLERENDAFKYMSKQDRELLISQMYMRNYLGINVAMDERTSARLRGYEVLGAMSL